MRRLVTPRWLGLHVLAVALVAAFLFLGWWQWGKGMETKSLQSLAYGLQWPIFAGFVVFMWFKMVREELHPKPDPSEEEAGGVDVSDLRTDPPTAVAVYDEELAAYNAYLARLNAAAERRR